VEKVLRHVASIDVASKKASVRIEEVGNMHTLFRY
jgi:hypothetical protein